MLRVAVMLAAIGCGSARTTPKDGTAPSNKAAEQSSADRAYAESIALDYNAPADQTRRTAARQRAVELFAAECKRGDKRACWRALAVQARFHPMLYDLAQIVGKQCIAGDVPSCNVLVAGRYLLVDLDTDKPDLAPAQALCEAGLGAACFAVHERVNGAGSLDEQADLTWLERGCKLGEVMSCNTLVSENRLGEEYEVLQERANKAIEAECDRGFILGCRFRDAADAHAAKVLLDACVDGLPDACNWMNLRQQSDSYRLKMSAIECPAKGETCVDLGKLELARGHADAARDAFEHGCHYGSFEACTAAVTGYQRKTFAEPVTGRADQISEFLRKQRSQHSP